ncbi:hypothetical protein E4T50_01504 [Aureobasidium sp. EXF-12298]|nr:hypothetical protein E4T50_01504 [Aureobasidium sp. EXF-12298]KAI4782813.1 hypothetical protein E4T52_02181 [Aureobasidium sp. EXF-3400]
MSTEPPSAAVEGGQETDVVQATEPQSGVNPPKKPHASQEKQQVCRFFNSKRASLAYQMWWVGCKAGNQCSFAHVQQAKPSASEAKPRAPKQKVARGDGRDAAATPQRQYEPRVDQSKVVSRPVTKTEQEDPRVFQMGQLRRRFAPSEEQLRDATLLKFKLAPSDPDFPFDLPFLDCSLTVPLSYPQTKPTLRITNSEMPRGFQLNVERGFDQIVIESPSATLLGVFNRLDRQLETLLSGEKADTVKIVRNTPRAESQAQPRPAAQVPKPQPKKTEAVPSFTTEQKLQAEKKRQSDIRQLVARLGRLPGFIQSSDDISFTIPFQPTKKVPEALRNQKSIRLVVPQLYNLHLPRIEVNGNHDPAARALEQSFQERVKSETSLTLLSHINWLTQNAHIMSTVKEPVDANEAEKQSEEAPKAEIVVPVLAQPSGATADQDSDKPHVHVIPRPPEWHTNDGPDGWSSDDSYSYDSGDETEEEQEGDQPEQPPASTSGLAERGIMLSFPNLELYGCELLELVSLSITVKCDRCKDLLDVQRLRNNTKGDASGMRDEICKKCANTLAVVTGFRADLIHQNSVRAGYLDLDGCTVVDMLPRQVDNVTNVVHQCSTSYPAPGVVGVRGDSILAICRECHRKMSFRIPETKFLHVSAAAVRASRAPTRRKIKENLGIVAGQELPRRGRCTHYAKSYRWFRYARLFTYSHAAAKSIPVM